MSLEKIVSRLVARVEGRYYGKYRGLVVENDDPNKIGRLKLRVPSVLGDAVVTGWALPCLPYGGSKDQGMLFIPDPGAGVWVEFEEGDLDYPVWVGTFWSQPGGDTELPRPNKPDGSEQSAAQSPPSCKLIKTAKGHTLQFEDQDGAEMVTLVEATHRHVVTLDREGIAITDGADGHKVLLNAEGITITDGKNQGNKISLKSGGITIETSGTQVALGATGIQIGGSGATEPFVLGNQFMAQVNAFMTALNIHTHGTSSPGAPTLPPLAPMTLQVPLSTKHRVE